MSKLQSMRGTHDIILEESDKFQHIVDTAQNTSKLYGYSTIHTPIFESTEVFCRPLGQSSDVVTKEMYSFDDRNGESITLRPEGTAGVVRAFIQNGLTHQTPFKAFYSGAMFRYERPQKGRQRQFHQFGAELLGVKNPIADAEMIAMGYSILQKLGLADKVTLHINSLGDKQSRDDYRQAITAYLEPYKNDLSDDSKTRLEKNPLRILDTKNQNDQEILKQAPIFYDYLNTQSREYFDSVLQCLEVLGVPFKKDYSLVRGFDYYCHTAFEFITDTLGAQGTVLGGGRYDGLCQLMGGPETAGIGFAAGIERLMMMIDCPAPQYQNPTVLIPLDTESEHISLKISALLREKHIPTLSTYSGNMKKRMKYADKVQAKFAIIIGETERQNKLYIVRNLTTGDQAELPMEKITQYITEGNA